MLPPRSVPAVGLTRAGLEPRWVARVRDDLLAWYGSHARDLPWRRTRDPYAIWLSEVMLQQTRVETVIDYYTRWLQALPTVATLAAADEEQVLKLWEGLGYYRRARNLHRAAQVVVAEHGGRLPRSAEGLRALPGIGPYTAGAVASIAFGEAVPVVDGNVKRVLARLLVIETSIDDTATTRQLWAAAEALVHAEAPGDFNQALMELGARICKPQRPACLLCPVADGCAAREAGRQGDLPVRKAKRPVPHARVVAALISRGGRYLLAKRPATGLLAGLWEFPGGTVEPSEDDRTALARILRETLGITIEVGGPRAQVDHAFTHLRVTIHLYDARLRAGAPTPTGYAEVRWARRTAFGEVALPRATQRLMAQVWPGDGPGP